MFLHLSQLFYQTDHFYKLDCSGVSVGICVHEWD